MLTYHKVQRGLWIVVDDLNQTYSYTTNERDARAMRKMMEDSPRLKLCCLPVAEGSPQGAPCLLRKGHPGRCNPYPDGGEVLRRYHIPRER